MVSAQLALGAKNPLLPSIGVALLLSLLLFGGMYSIIKVGKRKIERSEALATIDFVRLKRDSDLETLSRRKPPPPPPQPPPPPKMKISSAAVAQGGLPGM